MALRTQEWEHAGMIYFLELCGKMILPRTSPNEDSWSESSLEQENSEKDTSPGPDLQLNNPDPILELITPKSSTNFSDVSDQKDPKFTKAEEPADIQENYLLESDMEFDNQLESDGSMIAGDESEEKGCMFFKIFESLAKSFLRKSRTPAAVKT